VAIVNRFEILPKKVNVRVSYPIALPDDMRKLYTDILKTAMERISDEVNFKIAGTDTIDKKVSFFSESMCAAHAPPETFSNNAAKNPEKGYLVVDVGGGTTDIAVIGGDEHAMDVVAEISVKYAAQRMMEALYMNKSKIDVTQLKKAFLMIRKSLLSRADATRREDDTFEMIFGDAKRQVEINDNMDLPETSTGEEGAIATIIRRLNVMNERTLQEEQLFPFDFERLITTLEYGSKLCSNSTSTIGSYVSETVDYYRPKAKLASAALFFFIGALVRKLKATGQYKKNIPGIFLSGNGIRVFEWLYPSKQEYETYLTQFYKYGLQDGSNDEDIAVTLYTSEPEYRKHETALGLLMADDNYGDTTGPQQESSLMPDIAALFASETDYTKLKQKLKKAFELCGMYGDYEFKAANSQELREEAQKVVNPDYNEESQHEEIFKFLKAFHTHSPEDFSALFEDAIHCDQPLDDSSNEAIRKFISDKYNQLKAASAPKSTAPLPIQSANEFATLAFATAVLRSM